MQAQAPQPAQVALAKPPVVSVPAAVVSSPGVTTLPMNVAGISVAIGQPQKAAGTSWAAPPPPPLSRQRQPEWGDGSPAGFCAEAHFEHVWAPSGQSASQRCPRTNCSPCPNQLPFGTPHTFI